MSVELDPSLLPARTFPYNHTNSYRISFDVQDVNLHCSDGSLHIRTQSSVCCVPPHTLISHSYLQNKDLVQLYVILYIVSYISHKPIRELRHLASYVSQHNAMAYDTSPHQSLPMCNHQHLHLLPHLLPIQSKYIFTITPRLQ
jgi:hypothetical protein